MLSLNYQPGKLVSLWWCQQNICRSRQLTLCLTKLFTIQYNMQGKRLLIKEVLVVLPYSIIDWKEIIDYIKLETWNKDKRMNLIVVQIQIERKTKLVLWLSPHILIQTKLRFIHKHKKWNNMKHKSKRMNFNYHANQMEREPNLDPWLFSHMLIRF